MVPCLQIGPSTCRNSWLPQFIKGLVCIDKDIFLGGIWSAKIWDICSLILFFMSSVLKKHYVIPVRDQLSAAWITRCHRVNALSCSALLDVLYGSLQICN